MAVRKINEQRRTVREDTSNRVIDDAKLLSFMKEHSNTATRGLGMLNHILENSVKGHHEMFYHLSDEMQNEIENAIEECGFSSIDEFISLINDAHNAVNTFYWEVCHLKDKYDI